MRRQMRIMTSILACAALIVATGCKREGCTDMDATNYDDKAKTDDGSCMIPGCTDMDATNYNDNATEDNGMCEYSLYHRLGELPAIEAVVDEFLGNVVANDKLSCDTCDFGETIKDQARVTNLRTQLIDQICSATGGPCEYNGKTMREAHPAGSVTDDEFNELVGELVAAMNTLSVPQMEQDELLAILGSLKGDIVY